MPTIAEKVTRISDDVLLIKTHLEAGDCSKDFYTINILDERFTPQKAQEIMQNIAAALKLIPK